MDSSSSSSSSDDGFEEAEAVGALCLAVLEKSHETARRKGGSTVGRRGNREIGRSQGSTCLDADYFCRNSPEPPVFCVQEFERRFAVTRTIYELIRSTLCETDAYFRMKPDACGRMGASTDQKICAALLQLSSGNAPDQLVHTLRLSEPLLLQAMKRFCSTLIDAFSDTYLRRPSLADAKRINSVYERLGFPGCLGAVDCSGWEWRNCPVALQGQYKGKEGKPTIRMETVCDDKLWTWSMEFGAPGAKNDVSILSQSRFFNDIRTGKWPSFRPSVNIAGTNINWFYFLSDGIYSRFRIFAKPHSDPRTVKAKLYTRGHASARKAAERIFAALYGQFEILARPARLASVRDLNDIVLACSILHNMVAEERGYDGTAKFRLAEESLQTMPVEYSSNTVPTCIYEQAEQWRNLCDETESLSDHTKLLHALMENFWNSYGDMRDD